MFAESAGVKFSVNGPVRAFCCGAGSERCLAAGKLAKYPAEEVEK